MTPSTGALFTSFTVTLNVLVSLKLGDPLSVTRTVTGLVLGPWASVGVQLTTPLPALIVIPAGAPGSKLYVSVLAGTSVSLPLAVTVKRLPSLTVRSAITASTGALFTSFTVTLNARLALTLRAPLPITRTVTGLVPGPCASVGVQLNTPLLALIVMPAGAPGSKL